MSQTLYSTIDNLSVGGRRAGCAIVKTDKGIKVIYDTLYDEPKTTKYYRDGNHPAIPANWTRAINDSGTTEYDLFVHALKEYTPDCTVTR